MTESDLLCWDHVQNRMKTSRESNQLQCFFLCLFVCFLFRTHVFRLLFLFESLWFLVLFVVEIWRHWIDFFEAIRNCGDDSKWPLCYQLPWKQKNPINFSLVFFFFLKRSNGFQMEIWRRWIPIWFYFILKLWQWPKVTVTITWLATWGPTKNAVRFDIPQVDQVIWVFFFFSWVFQWKWLGCAPWNCSYDVGNCGDDRKWPPHVENHVQRCLQQTRTYLLLVILTSHVTNHRKLPLPSPHAQPSESKQKITQVSQKKISSGFWREMRGHAEGPTGTFGVSVAEEGVNLTTPILLIWCCCCCCCWGLGRRHHHQRQQKKTKKKKRNQKPHKNRKWALKKDPDEYIIAGNLVSMRI